MENISSIAGFDYASYVQDIIKSSASVNANASVLGAEQDILDTLIEGTFQMDSDVPENSTFSLHV